jgi:hypothetical protein
MSAAERQEPDFESLEEERAWLVDQVQAIEAQLSEQNRTHEDGTRLTGVEYHEWRGRAVTARKHLLIRLRRVKGELARHETDLGRVDRDWLARIEQKLDRLLGLVEKEDG